MPIYKMYFPRWKKYTPGLSGSFNFLKFLLTFKYKKLAEIIKERVDEVIMFSGSASDKIKEYLGNYTRMHEVSSMQEAVKIAKKLSNNGDIVILSPGAASFNLFKNEFDRGKQFIDAVKNLR